MSTWSKLAEHWPEYAIEAFALGLFMVSAGIVAVLVDDPGSPLRTWVPDPDVRRALAGLAMGLTAICIIYSPWGRRSGAHMNPAVTLTFLRLGKVSRTDAAAYVSAQFIGGLLGVLLVAALLGNRFTGPPVSYAATIPGNAGSAVAFAAEAVISCGLMLTVLTFSNSPRLMRYTGVAAGFLVATWITLEGPLSGMSMNPARSLASAAPGGQWQHLWIYFTAPPLGMLLAAGLYRRFASVHCAKLLHTADVRCIHCGYQPPAAIDAKIQGAKP